MFVTAINPTITRFLTDQMLNAIQTAPGAEFLAGAEVVLFTALANPIGPDSVQSDFTIATFGGYAAKTLTLGASNLNLPSLLGSGKTATVSWVHSGAGGAETILGYYVESAGGDVAWAELFQTPIPMVSLGDFIDLDVVIPVAWNVAI